MAEVGRILDEPDIRPTDHFIELGGNSMLALQVASMLKEQQIEINVAQLLGDRLENVFIEFTETQLESCE
nr:acyl carrier protein [Spartinivicinus marinus]